jgi:serpin B
MHRLSSSLLLFSLMACTSSESTEPPMIKSDLARDTTPDATDADLDTLVAGNTDFAADLYRLASGEDGNLFMSPHSITTALAMTYAGAANNTATQIADVFNFTQAPATLHASLNALDLELASRAQNGTSDTIPFKLRTANSIWGQDGFEVLDPFLDTLALNYGAGLHVLDFENETEASRQTINNWVEDQTNDKIKELLPQGVIQQSTKLVLTNAIYFSAAWQEPFEASDTQDRPFQVAGAPVQVPTLHQTADMNYGEGSGWKAVEIPYDGNELSMTVVVPDDLATFEQHLTGATFTQIADATTHHSVELYLPKFKFDSPLGLKSILKELGMTDAFDDAAADFSGIDGKRDLVITDVLHKGFVGIDENGTEAAAATAVVIGPTSIPEQATMVVDRPFVFFIKDNATGAILFVGRVVDPR